MADKGFARVVPFFYYQQRIAALNVYTRPEKHEVFQISHQVLKPKDYIFPLSCSLLRFCKQGIF